MTPQAGPVDVEAGLGRHLAVSRRIPRMSSSPSIRQLGSVGGLVFGFCDEGGDLNSNEPIMEESLDIHHFHPSDMNNPMVLLLFLRKSSKNLENLNLNPKISLDFPMSGAFVIRSDPD